MPAETPATRAAPVAGGAAPSGPAAQGPRRLGLALAVIATAELMIVLDLTIVTVARFPRVRVILGHMGETLPFFLWRLDQRAGAFADHAPQVRPSELVRRNIRVTTAGSFSDEPLRCALDALDEDNVMYSVDYPFESMTEASGWLDAAGLDARVRAKIEYRNAHALLKLNQPA